MVLEQNNLQLMTLAAVMLLVTVDNRNVFNSAKRLTQGGGKLFLYSRLRFADIVGSTFVLNRDLWIQ